MQRFRPAAVLLALIPAIGLAQSVAWDNSPHAAEIAAQIARLQPLLDQVNPADWIARGAPDTYVKQWQGVRTELADLTAAARGLDQQPRKLTAALETYFRLQSVEWHLESLIDAVRRYQAAAIGDRMSELLRSNAANRDALRDYITELAMQKEHEFTVLDQEAQRCRGQLNQIPTVRTAGKAAK